MTATTVAAFSASLDATVMKKVLPIVKKLCGRSTNPITQNILLSAGAGVLNLTVTDLDVAFTGPVGTSRGDGSVLITPEWLTGALTLEVEGQKAVVKGANNSRELKCADPEEYPLTFPKTEFDYWCTCDAEKFLGAVRGTVAHCALEKGRYALNGVLFELEHSKLGLCGTDGRRLAYRRIDAIGSAEKGFKADFKERGTTKYQVIVPSKVLNLLSQFSKLAEGELGMAINENRISFSRGHYMLRSLLVEGQFPDWRHVIPKDLDNPVIFEREAAIAAFTEARKYTSIESQAVRLEFGVNNRTRPDDPVTTKGLIWRTMSPAHGQACGELQLQTVPPPVAIGFDPSYLLAGLEDFEGRYVALELKDKETGAILHDGHKEDAFFLCMPIDI